MNLLKKSFFALFLIFISLSYITAQENQIDIEFIERTFKSSEDITFKINLRDSENNIIFKELDIIIEDIDKEHRIEKKVNSGEILFINLEEKKKSGEWKVNAIYGDIIETKSFFIESQEEIDISFQEELLVIENKGNIKIDKEIIIIIGEVEGEPKRLLLFPGEQEKYRLIAPEGNYNIKVVSENQELFSIRNVPLKGDGFTGEVIGTIDPSKKRPFAVGIYPNTENRDAMIQFMRSNKIVYTFMLIIFAAAILLAIERKYSFLARHKSKTL